MAALKAAHSADSMVARLVDHLTGWWVKKKAVMMGTSLVEMKAEHLGAPLVAKKAVRWAVWRVACLVGVMAFHSVEL